MTTPLIEAIARALCAAQGCHASENEMARARDEAQAALTAITEAGYAVVPVEPTKAIADAVFDEIEYCGCVRADAADAYRAMISAAQGDG